MEDKRFSERKERMIVIEFRKAGSTDEYYVGIIHNCSDNGFSFESQTLDFHSGTVLDFKLKHPHRDETINCLGDVVWTTKQNYDLIVRVKLHSVPTEKQNILDEIISSSSPPTASAKRKKIKLAQSPSALDRYPVQNDSYCEMISESFVSSFRKNSVEETGSPEDRDISETVPPEVTTKKSGSSSKIKSKTGKLLPILITILIISAFAVLTGFLIHKSSTERLSALHMSTYTVKEFPPDDREDAIPLNEIKEPVKSQIEAEPFITKSENTFLDTIPISVAGDESSLSTPTKSGEETINTYPDSLGESEKTETGITAIKEKIDPDPGFNQGVTGLTPDKYNPSESLNKESETVEPIAGERFIIHVAAWKTKEYAMSVNKKIMSFYPDAIMVFENNYHIIMFPNIESREEAFSIAEELADRFDVSPLIYVQQRNIPEISKTDEALP